MNKIKFNRLLRKIHKSRDAITKIYKYFYPLIVTHINYSFHGKLDGNDVAQQFFLELLKMEIKEFINYPVSWVYKISDYIAIGFIRKQDKRTTAEIRAAVKDEVYIPDNSQELLTCLNETQREIIYLRYWEKYTLIEISRLLNINYSTTKFIHTKAKNILKNKIKRNKSCYTN